MDNVDANPSGEAHHASPRSVGDQGDALVEQIRAILQDVEAAPSGGAPTTSPGPELSLSRAFELSSRVVRVAREAGAELGGLGGAYWRGAFEGLVSNALREISVRLPDEDRETLDPFLRFWAPPAQDVVPQKGGAPLQETPSMERATPEPTRAQGPPIQLKRFNRLDQRSNRKACPDEPATPRLAVSEYRSKNDVATFAGKERVSPADLRGPLGTTDAEEATGQFGPVTSPSRRGSTQVSPRHTRQVHDG